MAKNLTHEENVEFYTDELRILKVDLECENRFLKHVAKQLVTNDEFRATMHERLKELEDENNKLRRAFAEHGERIILTANEYLRK